MNAPPFGHFFLPGPTEVRHDVLLAMLRPMIPHRGAEFEALYDRLQQGLRMVFRTTQPVFIATASATGMMEAAIRCAPPGRVLALVNGAFSDRFARIGMACGRDVEVIEAAPGEVVDGDLVRERLAHAGVTVVLVVHSEPRPGCAPRAVPSATWLMPWRICLIDSGTRGRRHTARVSTSWDSTLP